MPLFARLVRSLPLDPCNPKKTWQAARCPNRHCRRLAAVRPEARKVYCECGVVFLIERQSVAR